MTIYTALTYSFPNLKPVCCSSVLTVASWPAYRFLRRQVRWSGIPMSFRIFQFILIHTVKGFSIVNKAEVDVFLELSCFFYELINVGNLISGFWCQKHLFLTPCIITVLLPFLSICIYLFLSESHCTPRSSFSPQRQLALFWLDHVIIYLCLTK